MHPFQLGKEYRRGDLLDFVGSKQGQSGVLWGDREAGCLICTSGGRHGKKAGYADEILDDGSWWYFGQGQKGDQSLQNAANAKLALGQRSVLLFTSREPTGMEKKAQGGYGKLYAFRGSFNVAGYEFVTPSVGPRNGDQLLKYYLLPADGDGSSFPDAVTPIFDDVDLTTLQRKLNAQPTNSVVAEKLALTEYRRRSALVHRYAILRAAGICEGCRLPAPFQNLDGQGFLEVHHLMRLADDGPDTPINVCALCPNCHRRAHNSIDRGEFTQKLRAYVFKVEQEISSNTAAIATPKS